MLRRAFSSSSTSTAAIIKSLRASTSAPISEVKAALEQSNWNIDDATKLLREKGLAAASKKSSRRAAEGLVGIATSSNAAAIVEINSETDFVARNEHFQALVSQVAEAALKSPGTGELDVKSLGVDEVVATVAAKVRENVRLRRAFRLEGQTIGTYLHASIAPGVGRIAGLVSFDGDVIEEDLAKKLAMQVVGGVPRFLDKSSIPEHIVEEERKLLANQAASTGKPANIIDKIVLGRLDKYYEEVCLLEQRYIVDDSLKVKDLVPKGSSLKDFYRVQVGEGLDKENQE